MHIPSRADIRFNVNNSNNKNARSVSSRKPEVPTAQNGGVKGVKGVLQVLEVSAGGWVSSPHWEHTHHSHFDQIDRRTGVDLGVRHLQSRKSPGLGDFVGGNRVQSFRCGECHFLTEGTQYPGTIRSANSVNNQKLFSSPNPKLKNTISGRAFPCECSSVGSTRLAGCASWSTRSQPNHPMSLGVQSPMWVPRTPKRRRRAHGAPWCLHGALFLCGPFGDVSLWDPIISPLGVGGGGGRGRDLH